MPDKDTLPTAVDIRQLPRWARVAFAARCARRVLPLFSEAWPDAPLTFRLTVTYSVDLSEAFAADPRFSMHYDWRSTAAGLVARAADDHAKAAKAAEAADFAFRAAVSIDPRADDAEFAARAARAAANADADAARWTSISALIRTDFVHLLLKSRSEKWTDATSVPPSVFDPIEEPIREPALKPAGTVTPPDPLARLKLKATVAPGVSAETVNTHTANVFAALQNLLRVKFNQELTREQFDRLLTVERREA